MKKGLLILAAAVIAGIIAYSLSRNPPGTGPDPVLLDSLPELAWLRTDLKLTDEQFTKVSALHREYRPVCAEMCRRIAESESAVAKLASSQSAMSGELAAAIAHHGHVIAECKRSMLEHLYQTAALMDESQARRYLDTTLPLALDSVRGERPSHHHE